MDPLISSFSFIRHSVDGELANNWNGYLEAISRVSITFIVCICMYVCVFMHVFVYMCLCVYMFVCICMCVYVCMCLCV